MKLYKLTCVCTLVILLSGCNAFLSITKESPSIVESEVVNNKDNEEEPTRNSHPIIIEAEIASPNGESKSLFTYADSIPVKISLSNTGTESFLYKIRSVNKDTNITEGILKSNESFEQIYDELPKGDYIISYVVEDEENPIDIKLKVKVELFP